MKTEEEKRAAFNALSGREQVECEGLVDLLEEHLGIEVSCSDVIGLNQAIKGNFDSLSEMDATPMRSLPSDNIDWKKRCKAAEAKLEEMERENENWAKIYIANHRSEHVRQGGYRAQMQNNGDVEIRR